MNVHKGSVLPAVPMASLLTGTVTIHRRTA